MWSRSASSWVDADPDVALVAAPVPVELCRALVAAPVPVERCRGVLGAGRQHQRHQADGCAALLQASNPAVGAQH
eukprot:1150866-Pelagomonas_calceolata.AAC.2